MFFNVFRLIPVRNSFVRIVVGISLTLQLLWIGFILKKNPPGWLGEVLESTGLSKFLEDPYLRISAAFFAVVLSLVFIGISICRRVIAALPFKNLWMLLTTDYLEAAQLAHGVPKRSTALLFDHVQELEDKANSIEKTLYPLAESLNVIIKRLEQRSIEAEEPEVAALDTSSCSSDQPIEGKPRHTSKIPISAKLISSPS